MAKNRVPPAFREIGGKVGQKIEPYFRRPFLIVLDLGPVERNGKHNPEQTQDVGLFPPPNQNSNYNSNATCCPDFWRIGHVTYTVSHGMRMALLAFFVCLVGMSCQYKWINTSLENVDW